MATVTVLTNAGLAHATGRITGATGNNPQYIHWGTGTGTAVVTNTVLFTAATESRTAGTVTREGTAVTNDTIKVTGRMTCNATGKTIKEAGLFDASTAGTMVIHSTFDGIALVQNDYIDFTFKIQAQQGA